MVFTHHSDDVLKASSLKLGNLVMPDDGDRNVFHVQSHQLPIHDDPSQLVAKRLKDPSEVENIGRLGILRHHGTEGPNPNSRTWAIMAKVPGVRIWDTKVLDWLRASSAQRAVVIEQAWCLVGKARLDYAKRHGLIHQIIPDDDFYNVNFEERSGVLTKAHLMGWGDATKVPIHLRRSDGTFSFTPEQEELIRKNIDVKKLHL
jgi:hypothetical protein